MRFRVGLHEQHLIHVVLGVGQEHVRTREVQTEGAVRGLVRGADDLVVVRFEIVEPVPEGATVPLKTAGSYRCLSSRPSPPSKTSTWLNKS